jgi:hypothetical protein
MAEGDAKTHEHRFDRRSEDVNVAALAFRVNRLESRMELVERGLKVNSRELNANTALTKQVHAMAERTEQNTKDIVQAVQWLSTTKKIVIGLVVGIGGLATTGAAVVGLVKLIG